MSKEEVDSILLVNKYLIECKCSKPQCPKTELARKYLTLKIKRALNRKHSVSSKALLVSLFSFLRVIFLQ
jgi:hypothetical protein